MASDIQFYITATEEDFKPYIVNLGGDWENMDLTQLNIFMYTKIKENPRLTLIQDEIIDETELLCVAQLFNFGSYFPVYDRYDINVNVDIVNMNKMIELYNYIQDAIDTVNEFSFTGIETKWVTDNQEFVTSHPAPHFKNHVWGEPYDLTLSGAFNYPEGSDGWEGLGLGLNVTPSSDSQINFFDKQDQNLTGSGFTSNMWNETDLFTTPWPPITASNQSNRSARNSYVVSRVAIQFSHDSLGVYNDYLYFIEADFRVQAGMGSEFFLEAGVDIDKVLTKMDEWDIININRESTYSGTRINIQRNITTLEALENRMKLDKTIIDNMES